MCLGGIDIPQTERRHMMDFADYFAHSLRQLKLLEGDGLVELSSRTIRATPRGRLLLRVVASCFDRYLTPQDGGAVQFSRTV
jgi:oxygen-independent coproporphyrinogen-3 oxidase